MNRSGLLSACIIAALWAGAQAGEAADEKTEAPRGRWLFRYDIPTPPPETKGAPDLVGVIEEVKQGDTRRWGLRLRIRDLDGTPHTVYVMQEARIDGQPASKGQEWLDAHVPVAVFGKMKLGRFYAESVFTILPEDWEQIKADHAGSAPPTPPELKPPAEGWAALEVEAPETETAEPGWPEKPWQPRHALPKPESRVVEAEREAEPKPEPEARAEEKRADKPEQIVAQVYTQRGDFVGQIVGRRNHGLELSVRTPKNVTLVLLDDATAIARGEEKLTPADLKEGDIVDVKAAGWLGAQSCTAKQIWVVEIK